jgi:hypothetical protein
MNPGLSDIVGLYSPNVRLEPKFVLDRVFVRAWRGLDAHLRRRQRIIEFTDHPRCLLRIALHQAERSCRLSSGFSITKGALIGDLHLWNEHIPRIPCGGPDLAWAMAARRQMRESLIMLAKMAPVVRPLSQMAALRAETRLGAMKTPAQLRRLAGLFGFEIVFRPAPCCLKERLVDLAEHLHFWAMMRAFNPEALRGRHYFKSKCHELWMPREALIRRYAAEGQNGSARLENYERPLNKPIKMNNGSEGLAAGPKPKVQLCQK